MIGKDRLQVIIRSKNGPPIAAVDSLAAQYFRYTPMKNIFARFSPSFLRLCSFARSIKANADHAHPSFVASELHRAFGAQAMNACSPARDFAKKFVIACMIVSMVNAATIPDARADQVPSAPEYGWVWNLDGQLILFDDPVSIAKAYCERVSLVFYGVTTPVNGDPRRMSALCRRASDPPDACCAALQGFGYMKSCSNAKSPYLVDVANTSECVFPDDNNKPPEMCNGRPENASGDPIDITTKETTLIETDYASASGFEFTRFYSSVKRMASTDGMLQGWHHNFSKRLLSTIWPNYHPLKRIVWNPKIPGWEDFGAPGSDGKHFAAVLLPNGYRYNFMSSDAGHTWSTDSDVKYRLVSTQFDSSGSVTQWQLITPEGNVDTYDQFGRWVSMTTRSGKSQNLTYNDVNLLTQVTDNFGRTLQFQYDAKNRLTRMTDPAAQTYDYTYDAANNLTNVAYPDGSARRYMYAEPAFDAVASNPDFNHLLTGTANVNGGSVARYATFNYDSQGRPISTELANGAYKFVLDYAANAITDPLGIKRNYSYTKINGVTRPILVPQPGGAGCGSSNMQVGYDVNGNKTYKIDFNGNRTNFTFDLTRNLETSRVEGASTALARTISTQWHPTYRLPTAIAEPRRRTSFEYDAAGNLLTKTEQASTDATGAAAFSATLTGPARTWRYTYNSLGQILTATAPRVDGTDITTYEYDAQGNLSSVTNAAGHRTTLSNYDVNDHVGTITDPNGLVTSLSHSPRGWLTARNVGGEVTTYSRDTAGQLTQVILPDGAIINYTYDDAQRLVGITDSAGNSIKYTLDAMGNHLSEQVRDPNGALSRQTTRLYDALNRLQQVTGAQQ